MIVDRPIAHFDTETTGTDPESARIIQIAVVRTEPDGTEIKKTFVVNPEIPIPSEASSVHGFTNEDVKDCPFFGSILDDLVSLFRGCIFAGYNVRLYDIPLLQKEVRRVTVAEDERRAIFENPDVIDTFEIFKRMEGMTLSLAYKFYTGKSLEGAHGAMADTEASIAVLNAQLSQYEELPDTASKVVANLLKKPDHFVDSTGRLVWKGDDVVFAFSKQKGNSLREVSKIDGGFLRWMLKSDFPADLKQIIDDALKGRFPERKTIPETELNGGDSVISKKTIPETELNGRDSAIAKKSSAESEVAAASSLF